MPLSWLPPTSSHLDLDTHDAFHDPESRVVVFLRYTGDPVFHHGDLVVTQNSVRGREQDADMRHAAREPEGVHVHFSQHVVEPRAVKTGVGALRDDPVPRRRRKFVDDIGALCSFDRMSGPSVLPELLVVGIVVVAHIDH